MIKDNPSFISALAKKFSSMLRLHMNKIGGLKREGEFSDPHRSKTTAPPGTHADAAELSQSRFHASPTWAPLCPTLH